MKTTAIRQLLLVASTLALALIAYADQERPISESTKLADLPPAVQKSIQAKIEGSTILQIATKPAVYCALLDANGQKSEVRVSEDGKVLRVRSKQEAEAQFEQEQRLVQAGELNTAELGTVPADVREIILDRSKGLSISRITKTPVIFVVRIDRSGEKSEIQLTEDGKVLGGSRN
jgi:hypothetical protein